MGFLAKIAGWAVAHRDALKTGWNIFRKLRGRRKATENTGESWKDYYRREGGNVLKDAVGYRAYTGSAPLRAPRNGVDVVDDGQ